MHSTQLSILRHGEVQGGRIFRGSQDDPLSPKGLQQMQQRILKENQPWDRLISSPLIRCSEFAQQFSQEHGIPLQIETALKEIHFGHWEGKSYTQIEQNQKELLERFYQNPLENTPPEGESLGHFQSRIIQAVNALIVKYAGEKLLLICHGGVQKVILCHALKMPLTAMHHIDTPYAALSRLTIYHQEQEPFWLLNQHGE